MTENKVEIETESAEEMRENDIADGFCVDSADVEPMISTGVWRTRDGRTAHVESKLNSGTWLGTVKDMFNQPMTVEWNREGRISPIYDSRWDLINPLDWIEHEAHFKSEDSNA